MTASFSERVYTLLKRIPRGKVTTYEELAHQLNSQAYRAVGTACKKNPNAPHVPCHRVITSSGALGGYAQGSARKKAMLISEGIAITNNHIDLTHYAHRF